MKKILAATLALSVFATAGVANAQSYRGHDNNSRHEQSRGSDHRVDQRGQSSNRYEQRASHRYSAGRYQAPRGYQARQWRRGDRMPSAYRGRAYVVDYHRYGLRAPPRGYHYVRSGNDAVLTAVATGVIASVVLSLFQ